MKRVRSLASGNLIAREDESFGAARVIRRSRLFFTVPIIIITVTGANLIWETIRANLDSGTLATWPFRFTILGDSTTATVLAVFVSLFMGRLQWARALRPSVGMAIDDEGIQFRPDSEKWRIWTYNAGPGGAVFGGISYYVRFIDQSDGDGPINWVPLSVVNDQLRSRQLVDGIDYFIRWNTRGAPFPAVKNYSEGMQLAWFTVKALTQIRVLDARLRYVDSLGDVHEKVIPIMQRLPSVALTAIRSASTTGKPSP
jgi:hypothetical protein